MAGAYEDQIASYQVIDCRFDYEFSGGHIRGAVNMNTAADIEGFLLGDNAPKPPPSCGGDKVKKTVLIFHCEFSEKRAPTLYVKYLLWLLSSCLIIPTIVRSIFVPRTGL